MDMNLQKYLAFIKTIELGSFSKAASALQYSQPAISKMIKDLEDELNVKLIERGKGGLKLTSEGETLLPYIKDICEGCARLTLKLTDMQQLKSGLIRIGAFASVTTYYLPDIIKRFNADYPNVDFEMLSGDYGEIENWIVEGRVDCGIVPLPTIQELDTIPLYRDKYMAILPKDHPLKKLEKIPVSALGQYPFMLAEKGGKSTISYYLDEHSVKPDIKFTSWDDYSIMRMVEDGLGISIIPERILERITYDIVIKELEQPLYRDVVLAMRCKDDISLSVKRFMEYILME